MRRDSYDWRGDTGNISSLRLGAVTRLGLADRNTDYPMRTTDALLPSEHIERFGARMRMHGRYAAGRASDFVNAKGDTALQPPWGVVQPQQPWCRPLMTHPRGRT